MLRFRTISRRVSQSRMYSKSLSVSLLPSPTCVIHITNGRTEAFSAQLRKILQIQTSDDDMMSMRSSNLGLDSLISVDIRSWFVKNFQVSIPVLKIMASDAQMLSLAEAAAEGIPAELIPHIRGDGKAITNGEEKATASGDDSSTASTPVTPTSVPSDQSPTTSASSATSADRDAPSDKIDWDAETSPPEGIVKLTDAKPPNPNPRVILLTGASGLLGHHLLNTLVAEPSIHKIICIAVRRLSDRLKTGELPPPSERIVYHEGDLGVPRFGLSEEEQSAIFNEVDAVIHNGADTSHLKYYLPLRATNVTSTKQLVRLCLQRMIPMHYISSAGMALFAGRDAFPEISGTTTGAQPPPDGAHGYMCAKWVCESLLERVNAAHGLPVWIQRPSTIIRSGDDATTAKADFDWVNALLHYSHAIQAVPRVEHNKGAFDLVEVQTCCDDIVGELVRNEPRLPNGMTYVNNVGDMVIPMHRMDEVVPLQKQNEKNKKKGGRNSTKYQVLPWDEWMQRAMKAGLHPAVAALVETFDEPGGPDYPALLRKPRREG